MPGPGEPWDTRAVAAAGFEAGAFALGDVLAAGAGPTFTNGMIFWMAAGFNPARERSDAEEYGRPAIIFLAVAGPTPGRVSRSFSEAELMSTEETAADWAAAAGWSDFLALSFASA